MKKIKFSLLLFFFAFSLVNAQKYKKMMDDYNVNFYDVVQEAENYFITHDKNAKGSGWKQYQRWKYKNEYKYFPTGNRKTVHPYFTKKAYQSFLKNNPGNTANKQSFTGWQELGPSRITNITDNHGVGLGRLDDFYVDPNNSDLIYAVSKSGGFWKTIDGGDTWTGGSTDFLVSTGSDIIAVSPSDPNHILINIRNPENGFSYGIYRSTDGGATWSITPFSRTAVSGLDDTFKIYTIAYHPTIANMVFIGTNKGFYKSTDDLATWTLINYQYRAYQIAFHPTNANIMYIYDRNVLGGNRNYVLRSTDQGDTFSRSNEIAGNNNDRLSFITTTADCPDCVYFASNQGIWKSSDKGVSFTQRSTPNVDINGLAVNQNDKTKMVYGYIDLHKSTNEGTSFSQVTHWSLNQTNGTGSMLNKFLTATDYVHADMRKIKNISGDFYVVTDGFICKSADNGTTWEILGQGIATRENYKLAVSQSNTERSISGSQDNGVSIKTEDGWLEFAGGDGMDGVIHPLNDDWMIGSTQNGRRRRTQDGGLSQSTATPTGAENGSWEAPILLDPNNHMTVYDFREKVYKSTDFGISHQNVGQPTFHPFAIQQAAIAENNSSIMVVTYNEKIEKSTDGGATFVDIRNNLPNSNIMDVAFDPNDDNTIIVVYAKYTNDGDKVYKTTDGGTNWTNITNNLGNIPVHSVVIDHTSDANIYIGTELGLYTMPMSGSNWVLYNTDLPNTSIEDLKIVYGSNTIKAATWGRGLWEYSLVGRNNYPRILTTKITDQPTESRPLVNVDQFVTSTIEYNGTLTNVEVQWSANNPTFNNSINMSNTTGNTWVSDTAIPNQTVDTKVFFRVVVTGSNNDTSETYKFMYTLKPFEYCDAQSHYTDEEHISNVTFNTIDNSSGASTYSDYTNISTNLTQNVDYDLSVSHTKDYNTDQVKVWIDFNQNADFTDAGEEFTFPMGSGNNGNTPVTQSIHIPNNAMIGSTRMRVRLYDTSIGANSTPCGSSEYGEVEDYTVNIIQNTATVLNNSMSNFVIYPNPTNGKITIDLKEEFANIKVKVTNVLGQTIINSDYNTTATINLNLKDNRKGIYFISISTDTKKSSVFKIVLK